MIFPCAMILQLLFWHPFQFWRGRIEHLSPEGSLLGPFIEKKKKNATLWAVPASPQTALVYLSVLQVRVLALCRSSSISVFGMDSIFSHSYFLIQHSLRNRLMGFAWNVKCQNTEPSTNSIYKAWYKCSSRSDRSICQEHCELRTAYRKGKRCINRLRNNWCSVGTSRLPLHDPEISIPISLPLFPNSTLSENLWQRKGTQNTVLCSWWLLKLPPLLLPVAKVSA